MKISENQSGVYCLNRNWKFKEVTDILTYPEKDTAHNEVYSATKGGHARGPVSATFDTQGWEDVTLPHDWVTKKPFDKNQSSSGGYKERGVAWYRHSFKLDDTDRKKQILLEYEGMSAEAVVYVNGFVIERSYSGYTPFFADITHIANFGLTPNIIAIYIDARGKEGWWYEGAGIYRPIWLVKKPPVHFAYDGIFVKPQKTDDKWRIDIQAEIENSFKDDSDCVIQININNPDGECIASKTINKYIKGFSDDIIKETIILENNPELWDIENPCLYTATFILDNDYIKIPFGFRTIRFCSKTGFYLNEKPLKLLGMCNHQDHAGVGVAVPYAIKEWRVKLLKDMGANAYRCAHNTDPDILDICDRLGMLVMEENRTFSPSRDAVRNIELMVRHSRNHPSVIMYSLFNEEPTAGTYKGHLISAKLKQAILRHDDTRPTTCAMNGGYMEETGATDIVDVAGINYHPQAYAQFHEKFPDKPLIGSETTSSFSTRSEWKTNYDKNTIAGHDESCASWSNHVRTAWKYVATQDFVAGTFVWTGFDYRGEPTPCPWPSVSSFFGTFDSCGFEKDPVNLYRAYWKKTPIVHIAAHWNIPVNEGEEVRVRVFTNCEVIKLFGTRRC